MKVQELIDVLLPFADKDVKELRDENGYISWDWGTPSGIMLDALSELGAATNGLFSINDVLDEYVCTVEDAEEVIGRMEHYFDPNYGYAWATMHLHADRYGLKRKEEEEE